MSRVLNPAITSVTISYFCIFQEILRYHGFIRFLSSLARHGFTLSDYVNNSTREKGSCVFHVFLNILFLKLVIHWENIQLVPCTTKPSHCAILAVSIVCIVLIWLSVTFEPISTSQYSFGFENCFCILGQICDHAILWEVTNLTDCFLSFL